MHNKDIREAISAAGLRYWQVAEAYGCTDGNFSRKLRKELPEEEKNKIFEAIKRLKQEREVV